jgi:parallel beta-helix repeat protein
MIRFLYETLFHKIYLEVSTDDFSKTLLGRKGSEWNRFTVTELLLLYLKEKGVGKINRKIVLAVFFLVCFSAAMLPQLEGQLKTRESISPSEEGPYLDLINPWNVSGTLVLDWTTYSWHTVIFHNVDGFNITANNTQLDLNGHSVMFSTEVYQAKGNIGIAVRNKSGVTIRNGTVTGFQYGVLVEGSSEVSLESINVSASRKDGIDVDGSEEVSLTSVNVSGSGLEGICVDEKSSHVSMLNNVVSGSASDGISILGNSAGVSILNSRVSGSGDVGVDIEGNSSEVSILNSTVKNSTGEGIHCVDSNHNLFSGNEISNSSYYGIFLNNSNNNTICNNTLADNVGNGQPRAIYMDTAAQNIIYHNNFLGQQDVECNNANGTWDVGYGTTRDSGYGGNYWEKQAGKDAFSGANQDVEGSDGISDKGYTIDANNKDGYPLMKPWGSMLVDFPLNCTVLGKEETRQVAVFSNASINDFTYNKTVCAISFTANNGTFCRVIILREALDGSFSVTVNNAPVACMLSWDGNHHFVDLNLTARSCNVKITGEMAMIGDINRDGKVNIIDISKVAKNYNP